MTWIVTVFPSGRELGPFFLRATAEAVALRIAESHPSWRVMVNPRVFAQ